MKICFWNYKKLAEDFVRGKISEEQKFAYYLIAWFVPAIVSYILTGEPEYSYPSGIMEKVITLTVLPLYILLIYYLFRINKKSDNKDFVVRWLAFQISISVRSFVIMALIFVFMKLGLLIQSEIAKVIVMWAGVISLFGAIFYIGYMAVKSFRYIAYYDAILNKKVSLGNFAKGAKLTKKKVSITGGKVKENPVAKAKKRK